MKTLLYNEGKHVGGEPEDEEARVVMAILRTYFMPACGHILTWLFFDTPTGCGHDIATGQFVLKPSARQKIWRKGLGVAPVPLQFQQTIFDFGPQGLRWNGKAIVASGN